MARSKGAFLDFEGPMVPRASPETLYGILEQDNLSFQPRKRQSRND